MKLLKNEVLKQISFDENYFISNLGRVFSKNKYKEITVLKNKPNNKGYVRIDFRQGKKKI